MDKPKICFITPPSLFLLDERVFAALGVLKVAAVAEQSGYNVEHLDLNGDGDYQRTVQLHATATKARVFALTATTPQMPAAAKIAEIIREVRPEARLVIGGPHPTLVHAAYKRSSERALPALAALLDRFDVVVCGDGEQTVRLFTAPTCPTLIDSDDPANDRFIDVKKPWPYPARHLIDMESYHYTIDGVKVHGLITQLGCPFNCGFCAGRNSPMLRRSRMRLTEDVIGEMKHLHDRYGIHGFMFFDDELNLNHNRTIELMKTIDKLQRDLGMEFRCRGFVKAELFNEEQGRAMYRAGFRRLLCGFESGSPKILHNINKKATREDNTKAVAVSKQCGLEMKALMSIGHPGESKETIQETVDWLLEVKPADLDVTVITPYPGSPYYDDARQDGDRWKYTIHGDALYMADLDYITTTNYYKGRIGEYAAYVWTDHVSAEELVKLRDEAEIEVRTKLGIPFYKSAMSSIEHSMGMTQ